MNAVVREWHDKAGKDLESAFLEVGRGDAGNFDLICFLCQQGVEKLLKGAIIAHQKTPPKTHDLVQLHRMLAELAATWHWDETELHWLSAAAVSFRYPGESADRTTAQRAADVAQRIKPVLMLLLS